MQKIDITIEEAAVIVKLIDAVVSRGAVRGDEMSLVGRVRDGLANKVNEASQDDENKDSTGEEGIG